MKKCKKSHVKGETRLKNFKNDPISFNFITSVKKLSMCSHHMQVEQHLHISSYWILYWRCPNMWLAVPGIWVFSNFMTTWKATGILCKFWLSSLEPATSKTTEQLRGAQPDAPCVYERQTDKNTSEYVCFPLFHFQMRLEVVISDLNTFFVHAPSRITLLGVLQSKQECVGGRC